MGVTVNAYVDITSNTIQYYVKLSGVTNEMSALTGWSNATYTCTESADTYTAGSNTITEQDGKTFTFELSGDALTIETENKEDEDCTVAFVLEKASGSNISGVQENCSLFEAFGLTEL